MKKLILLFSILFYSFHPLYAKELRVEAMPVDMSVVKDSIGYTVSGSSVFSLDGYFVWGASPIKGDDGRYYMIYSASETGKYPFTQAWVLGSKLGVAVSDRPDGGFKDLGIFYNPDGFEPDTASWDAQSVYNPHVRKFGNRYYLYYAGTVDPGENSVWPTPQSLSRRDRVQQNQKIGVIVFDTFDDLLAGRFRKPDHPLLAPRTRVKPDNVVWPSPAGTEPKPDNLVVVNPSVVYRPSDGKYLLFFKGNIYDPGWRGIHGVAISDAPDGPFVPLDIPVLSISGEEGSLSAEDPYVWYHQADSCFYAVFKDFTGRFTRGEPCLAIMKSADGIEWTLPEHSMLMKKEILLPYGTPLKVNRLERPQLLTDDDGNPIALYAACAVTDVNPRTDGGSFNVQIPLRPIPLPPHSSSLPK